MEKPKIAMVAGIQKKDRGLGHQNDLLYKVTEDQKRFRNITTGGIVIMGRKTWESIPDKFRPLPDRDNIVITRQDNYDAPGATVVSSFAGALEKAGEAPKDIFVIGGGEIYREALPKTDRLYLTIFDSDKEADIFFPDYSEFTKVIEQQKKTDPKTGLSYEFVTLERT